MPPKSRLDRLADAVRRLQHAVLEADTAQTPARLRRSAYDGAVDEPVLDRYVATVRDHAQRVTDADITALGGAGLSEDAIFELTVAAAVGAATRRLVTGLALLDHSQSS
jgi:alkylhydroperoxidase family enzyme